MGDPVGPLEEHTELIWRYHLLANSHGGLTVFHEVGEESLPIYVDLGLSVLKIGEEASVDLETFDLEGHARKPLRHVHRRAEKEGSSFEVVPAAGVPPLLGELRAISEAWLADKRTREKRFSLGRFDEAYLARLPVALVRHGGRVVAFATLWPGAAGGELSIDLMRYLPDAPVGVMDYLFVSLMQWGRQQHFSSFNLGMAPLSGLRTGPFSPLWNRLAAIVYRYGEHFYNFQGLRQYKEKFQPSWHPHYLVCPGGAALPSVLTDLAALISGGLIGALRK